MPVQDLGHHLGDAGEREPAGQEGGHRLFVGRIQGRRGGTAPAAVNAANEEAVTAFQAGRLPFLGLAEVVTEVLGRHRPPDDLDLDAVLATERRSRDLARTLVEDLITTRGTR